MVHIVVRLYAAPGGMKRLRRYEKKALAIFRAHHGRVIAAFQPDRVAGPKPLLDEVQVLRIPTLRAFRRFMSDPRRTCMARERGLAIRKTDIFISKRPVHYFPVAERKG